MGENAKARAIRRLWREGLPVSYIARCHAVSEQKVTEICVGVLA